MELEDEIEAAVAEWLSTKPQCVQDLAKEFPASTVILCDDKKFFILGWTENDMLAVTPIDPADNYDGAVAAVEYLCADCCRNNEKGIIC